MKLIRPNSRTANNNPYRNRDKPSAITIYLNFSNKLMEKVTKHWM